MFPGLTKIIDKRRLADWFPVSKAIAKQKNDATCVSRKAIGKSRFAFPEPRFVISPD